MRFSDWLTGKASHGGQSNSDVPHSGYFEELRVCVFRVACVFLSVLCTASTSPGLKSNLNKSAILLSLPLSQADVQTLFHDAALFIFRLCGCCGAGQWCARVHRWWFWEQNWRPRFNPCWIFCTLVSVWGLFAGAGKWKHFCIKMLKFWSQLERINSVHDIGGLAKMS